MKVHLRYVNSPRPVELLPDFKAVPEVGDRIVRSGGSLVRVIGRVFQPDGDAVVLHVEPTNTYLDP